MSGLASTIKIEENLSASFINFLFGSKERFFFSIWYVFVLSFLLVVKTFENQWNPILSEIGATIPILGEIIPNEAFLMDISKFLVVASAFYWLAMAAISSLRPGDTWPLFPRKESGLIKMAFFIGLNIALFIIVAIFTWIIIDTPQFELTVISVYILWAIVSVYFIFWGFQNVVFRLERALKPIPKPQKPLFIIGTVLLIDVLVPLPVILLVREVYDLSFVESAQALSDFGFIGGYIILVVVLTSISCFIAFYHQVIDRSKMKYIPVFHLLGLVYFTIIVVKALFFDMENAILRAWSLVINLVFIVIVLVLGIRRIAQLIGPLVADEYKKKLNPRTLTLFVFYITALYLVLLDFSEALLPYFENFVRAIPFPTILLFIQNFIVGVLSGGWDWLFFIIFAPVAFLLYFLTSNFSDCPDPYRAYQIPSTKKPTENKPSGSDPYIHTTESIRKRKKPSNK
ncbi:MAG: hypothetical protein ACFFCZ_31435 [Promethearchaeota archaeon]